MEPEVAKEDKSTVNVELSPLVKLRLFPDSDAVVSSEPVDADPPVIPVSPEPSPKKDPVKDPDRCA